MNFKVWRILFKRKHGFSTHGRKTWSAWAWRTLRTPGIGVVPLAMHQAMATWAVPHSQFSSAVSVECSRLIATSCLWKCSVWAVLLCHILHGIKQSRPRSVFPRNSLWLVELSSHFMPQFSSLPSKVIHHHPFSVFIPGGLILVYVAPRICSLSEMAALGPEGGVLGVHFPVKAPGWLFKMNGTGLLSRFLIAIWKTHTLWKTVS